MLRCCALDFQGEWEQLLPLIEFSYNNSYHSVINMAPYEALYGRRCITPHCCHEPGDKLDIGPNLIRDTIEKIQVIQKRIKAANNRQEAYANLKK